MSVTVSFATAEESEILFNLWQLYMQDLAEFRTSKVRLDGQFRDDRLRTYLRYTEHWPCLIRRQEEITGFALVRKSKPETYLIGEFFIKSEFRRAGIGRAAVAQILKMFIGDWEIPFQAENSKGAAFWRKTILDLGYNATEIVLPVTENQGLPPDIVLSIIS